MKSKQSLKREKSTQSIQYLFKTMVKRKWYTNNEIWYAVSYEMILIFFFVFFHSVCSMKRQRRSIYVHFARNIYEIRVSSVKNFKIKCIFRHTIITTKTHMFYIWMNKRQKKIKQNISFFRHFVFIYFFNFCLLLAYWREKVRCQNAIEWKNFFFRTFHWIIVILEEHFYTTIINIISKYITVNR